MAIGCRPCGKAGASVHLEQIRFRLEGVSNLAFRPFARTAKKRRNKVVKEEGTHTKHQRKKRIWTEDERTTFLEPKWLPKSIPRPFVSLLAPGFAQDRPQDASKNALASLRRRKNNFGCARGRPKVISQIFWAPLKTYGVFYTSILAPFS